MSNSTVATASVVDATSTASTTNSSNPKPPPTQEQLRNRFETAKTTLDYVSRFNCLNDKPEDRYSHYLNMLTQCVALNTSTNTFIVRFSTEDGITYVTRTKKDLKEYLSVIIFKDNRQRDIKLSSIIETSEFRDGIARYRSVKLVSDNPSVFQLWSGLPQGSYHQEYIDELQKYLQNIVEDKARDLLLDTLSWLVQHKWKKQNLSFVFIAPKGGEGKTTMAKIITKLVPNNSNTELDFGQITGRFNSHLRNLLYGNIGEISSDSTNSNHGTIIKLKQLTNDEQVYESKGVDIDATTDNANFTFLTACSNNYNVLGIYNDQAIRRRWVPVEFRSVYTDFDKLYRVINSKDFGATLTQWLQTRDISNFNPMKYPPEMAVMPKILETSRSSIFDFVDDALTQSNFVLHDKGKYAGKFIIAASTFAKLYNDYVNEMHLQKKLDPKNYVSQLTTAGYLVADRVSFNGKQQRVYIWLKDLPKDESTDVIIQDATNLDA